MLLKALTKATESSKILLGHKCNDYKPTEQRNINAQNGLNCTGCHDLTTRAKDNSLQHFV